METQKYLLREKAGKRGVGVGVGVGGDGDGDVL